MRFLSRGELACFAALVLAVVFAPAITGGGFMLTILGYTFAFAIFAMSVHVVLGWIGEIPLGHSLYFGLGAYCTGILTKDGWSFITAAVVSILIAFALAAAIGLLTLRLTGAYFSIVSWGLASVAVIAANSWDSVTGGALGLLGVPPSMLGSFTLTDPYDFAVVSGIALLVIIAGLAFARNSRIGKRVNGGRINNNLIRAAGANIYRDRVLTFALSGALAALSGALCLSYLRVVTPNVLGVMTTVEALVMVLLGGTAFLLGPVIGAAFFRILPEQIHLDAEVRTIVVSALVLVIVMLAPGGLPDVLKRLYGYIRKKPGKRRAADAETARDLEGSNL